MTEKKPTAVRQEEIIAAALSLVERQGLDNLNMADIAAAVHLVPSALYRHFRGKDAIVAGMIAYIGRGLQRNMQEVLQAERTAPARLQMLFARHWQFVREHRGVLQMFLILLTGNDKAALRQQMLAVVTPYVDQVSRVVAQGQRAGEICPGIAPSSAALLLIGMVQNLALLSTLGMPLTAEYQQEIWRIYWQGIAPRGNEN